MFAGFNSYHIYYNNGCIHHYNADGSVINELDESGWYVRVGVNLPWGPFPDQRKAIESLLIEWERFEPGYFNEEDDKL